ncbi:MAG: signal recognition particle protein [Dehalococcoidia bacterium]
MLDALSDRLQTTFKRLGSRGKITEEDLDVALREVRVALLEADVNFKVVRDFIARVRERALGADVTQSVTPGQQIVSIVNQELVEVLGGDSEPLRTASNGPTKILVCGIKGSGKTTLCGRLAQRLKRDGMKPLLVSTDFERLAATEQLQVLGRQIDVPVYVEEREAPAVEVGKRALKEAERLGANAIIVDTRGAVALDDDLADELAELADEVDPIEVLIVVDAMTGQEAVTLAKEFDEAIEGTGIVVTKLDSDTRGGAVLSVREVTGLPVKFITTGERLDALEDFHPDRFASRVLGMGDIVSLVERAQQTMGDKKVEDVARRMKSGQFDLEDFLEQLAQLRQMGSLAGMLDMIPGMSQLKDKAQIADMNEAFLNKSEAIIQSMTIEERRNPDLLNGSRRRRVANGSGTTPADVNRLLNQYREAKKLMQVMAGGGGKGGGGLRRMLGF